MTVECDELELDELEVEDGGAVVEDDVGGREEELDDELLDELLLELVGGGVLEELEGREVGGRDELLEEEADVGVELVEVLEAELEADGVEEGILVVLDDMVKDERPEKSRLTRSLSAAMGARLASRIERN